MHNEKVSDKAGWKIAAKRDSKKVPRRPGEIHSRSQESVERRRYDNVM